MNLQNTSHILRKKKEHFDVLQGLVVWRIWGDMCLSVGVAAPPPSLCACVCSQMSSRRWQQQLELATADLNWINCEYTVYLLTNVKDTFSVVSSVLHVLRKFHSWCSDKWAGLVPGDVTPPSSLKSVFSHCAVRLITLTMTGHHMSTDLLGVAVLSPDCTDSLCFAL